jgi:hypothetical protein
MASLLRSIGGCATSYPSNYPKLKRSSACRPKPAPKSKSKGRRLMA